LDKSRKRFSPEQIITMLLEAEVFLTQRTYRFLYFLKLKLFFLNEKKNLYWTSIYYVKGKVLLGLQTKP
jgi:hypothetical protein